MASRRGGIERVLSKLKNSIENENYYEAHQMYRTLYFRSVWVCSVLTETEGYTWQIYWTEEIRGAAGHVIWRSRPALLPRAGGQWDGPRQALYWHPQRGGVFTRGNTFHQNFQVRNVSHYTNTQMSYYCVPLCSGCISWFPVITLTSRCICPLVWNGPAKTQTLPWVTLVCTRYNYYCE